MLEHIRDFWRLPDLGGDDEKVNVARLLRGLLAVTLAGTLAFGAASLFLWRSTSLVLGLVLVLLLAFLGLFILLRRGHLHAVALLLLTLLWLAFTLPAWRFGGLHDTSMFGYLVVLIVAALAGGGAILGLFLLLTLLSVGVMFVAENMGLITPSVVVPTQLNDLALLLIILAVSAFILIYAVRNTAGLYRRARQTALALADTNRELQASHVALQEQRLVLERRGRYLEATGVVAREAASSVEEPQRLFSSLVHLISDQFNFYHTGLFLLDSAGEWVELRAASSPGGQRMLARGHRLRVGQEGVVGRAAGLGRAVIARDLVSEHSEQAFISNPDLPETRSEVALPLHARDRILGVLDVQSQEARAFSDEDLAMLQGLADQVAVALDNASLFEQLQASLTAERRAFGQVSRTAWRELLSTQGGLGFVSDGRGTAPQPVTAHLEPQMADALRSGQVSLAPGLEGGPSLSIPIKIRDQVIGVVDGRKASGEWTREEIEFLTTLTEQLNLALDGARLYGEAQQRAARDRVLAAVTGRVREAMEVDTMLQVAVQEMRRALGMDEVEVRIGLVLEPDNGSTQQPGAIGRGPQ